MNIKEAKPYLRAFMRANYSDERLAWLLAHARSGKLAYNSCCCFIGVATADHALRDLLSTGLGAHLAYARELPGSACAELAYAHLSGCEDIATADAERQRIIIPMILAEMRRRERSRAAADKLDAILAEIRATSESAKELATA